MHDPVTVALARAAGTCTPRRPATDQMLANPAEQANAIVYLVLSMVAGFLLVELGLWLGGRLRRI